MTTRDYRSNRTAVVTMTNGDVFYFDIPQSINRAPDKDIKEWAVFKAFNSLKMVWDVRIVDREGEPDMAADIEIPTVEFVTDDN